MVDMKGLVQKLGAGQLMQITPHIPLVLLAVAADHASACACRGAGGDLEGAREGWGRGCRGVRHCMSYDAFTQRLEASSCQRAASEGA